MEITINVCQLEKKIGNVWNYSIAFPMIAPWTHEALRKKLKWNKSHGVLSGLESVWAGKTTSL